MNDLPDVERAICARCYRWITWSPRGPNYWRAEAPAGPWRPGQQAVGRCGLLADHVPARLPADLEPATIEAWLAS